MAPETQSASTDTDPATASIDDRDRRALEQYLTVLDDIGVAADAPDLYVVVSESGNQYLVDVRGSGTCGCPDSRHRDVQCKHIRRTRYASGRDAIPAGIPRDDIDDQLGDHLNADPVYADDQELVTDGGVTATNTAGSTADAGGDTDE